MAMPNSGYGGGRGGQYDNAPLMQGGFGQAGPPPSGSYQGGGYPQHGGGAYADGFGGAAGGPGNNMLKMSTNTEMNVVFFAAACCIMLGSFIGGISMFFSLQMVDFIGMSYLLMFGGLLAVLDTPFFKTIKLIIDLRMYISKYIQFVTRVTGKGITFVFLGSALFVEMWDNLANNFLLFLSVVLCLFPVVVGMSFVVIGIVKSSKLDKARNQLAAMGQIEQRYEQYAQTYRGPQGGLTMAEFNGLTMENGGFKFETPDLKLIFNALVSNPAWRPSAMAAQSNQGGYQNQDEQMKIPRQDLLDWVRGGTVAL
mmetsp:Transcript_12001/g.31751  ORF Transcript_12001/g.31751 Transcript_12001/m.31751 type:complete len:311 (-) Transcript_12001:139-1071(-)